MKYVVCVGDGMADVPVDALDGRTPLQAAECPTFTRLAVSGIVGTVRTIPPGMEPGTDVGMISVFGYDPLQHFKGRGPWEAASMGIELGPTDVAWRCNLVTLKQGSMHDYSAGHITSEEAKILIHMLDKKLGGKDLRFYPGVGYRHVMVWKGGSDQVKSTAPHNIMSKAVEAFLPTGRGEKRLRQIMEDAALLLDGHEINRLRRSEGHAPANAIWPWGAGCRPTITTYRDRYHLEGSVISAVDIVKGMGLLAGFEAVHVPGATGYYDTNYSGKADASIKALKKKDYCMVHLEAPDEASHNGHVEEKMTSIRRLDDDILRPIVEWLESHHAKTGTPYRILVLADHVTEVVGRCHHGAPVPFLMAGDACAPNGAMRYDEPSATATGTHVDNGVALIEWFMRGSRA